ncbi:dicarboxylic acid transporter [Lactarius akahatsu]|uniref:Dicarboxylic acid transporter n=1 Tax=Lactarius akahatsu TaxID=416441 RepID=A0AAD4QC28_9AGAM|nr:dicarboxylic acid transporter [Lactarius akahatsu]
MAQQHRGYPFWSVTWGVAASLAACCTHPLDLVKVRMQTLKPVPEAKPISAVTILRGTFAKSGVRSLYTGVTASILRQMTYSLVRLGSYEKMKLSLSREGRANSWRLLLAAMVAGGLGGVAGNPADVLLVRMTSDVSRPPEKRYNYPNALTGLVSLLRSEGMRGLARGAGPNVVRKTLAGSQVGSYDFFKSKLMHKVIPVFNTKLNDSILLHSISSCLAGLVATTVCAPADVLKSRLMSQSGDIGLMKVLKRSLRDEGPRFLFRGWTPAFVRLGPNTVLLFVFFEQLKKGWDTVTLEFS